MNEHRLLGRDGGVSNDALGTEFLIKSTGLPSLATYYSAIGQGTPWQTAFQQAVGVTPDEFYRTFEEYRVRGFR